MLKARLLTSAVLFPLAIWIVLYSSTLVYMISCLTVFLLAVWEWSNLLGKLAWYWRLSYTLVMLFILYTVPMVPLAYWIVLGVAWWSIVIYLVCLYPNYKQYWSNPWSIGMMSIAVLCPFMIALVGLRSTEFGPWLLLYVFAVVWAADVGAYFVGRSFGRRRLAPQVSPGKTWEGLLGGGVLAVVVGIGLVYWCLPDLVQVFKGWRNMSLLLVFLIIASVLGDLFESMLKRERGIKDSGRLLPGHGGVLDRIDGLLATLPVMSFFWLLAQTRLH